MKIKISGKATSQDSIQDTNHLEINPSSNCPFIKRLKPASDPLIRPDKNKGISQERCLACIFGIAFKEGGSYKIN